jgi:hypothetical protein
MFSCSEKWETYYNEDVELEEQSPLTLYEYFEGEAQYSDFFNLLKQEGVDTELSKDQLMTVWAVKNENFDLSIVGNIDDSIVANYHLNYLSLGTSDLKNGQRIPTFSGIYLNIERSGDQVFVNSKDILSTSYFKNGVVHEVSTVLKPLTNMLDFIMLLDDDYSIIRDSIVNYNEQKFDKDNSIPIGVDQTGNTLYDSVFFTYNPLFDTINFSSEFNQYTLFIPSNDKVEGAFEKLSTQYDLMGKKLTKKDTLLAINWIKRAIFHEGEIASYGEKLDLTSPFGKVWRTSVQLVDESSMQQLSNGVVYEVTDLKIPNNVIIDRIKSLVHYYEYLSPDQQEELYTIKGAKEFSIVKGDESPVSGFYYWIFDALGDENSNDEFSVEFTPLDFNAETGEVSIMKIPPGEYNLYMGFRSKGHPYVDIYFHPGSDPIPAGISPVATEIAASNSTPWNYDRVNETDPDIKKWNGLGGLVGVVNVPGNEMTTFRIKVKFNKLQAIGASKRLQIYHWTLKPTENNY